MTKIRENTYRINASCKLDDINDELGTKLYSEDNDSLGGFISEKLDRIPKAGDKLTIDNVWLFVERSSANRAESIILKLIDKPSDVKAKSKSRNTGLDINFRLYYGFLLYPRFRTVPYNNILHRTSTYTNIKKGCNNLL